jgi:SAM-dependent methyltransferase
MRFHDKKFAADYDRRLAAEGYPGEIPEMISAVLKKSGSLIDVGAGSGFVAVPLARTGFTVTAIEPSEAMTALFEEKITDDIRNSITVVTCPWELWEGPRHDGVVSVHSLYPMSDLSDALARMTHAGSVRIVIVGYDSRNTVTDAVRKRLGLGSVRGGVYRKVEEYLELESLPFNRTDYIQIRKSTFSSIRDEADHFCFHLNIPADEKNCGEITAVLDEMSRCDDGIYSIESQYHDCMIVW